MKKYGLLHIQKNIVLSFQTSENHGDCCCDVAHELVTNNDKLWLVDSPEHAEWARLNNTPWYNANYDTPVNSYEPEELKVVEVIIKIEDINVKIPSFEEMAKFRTVGNKNEFEYLLALKNDNPDLFYDLYDLQRYLCEKNGTKNKKG